jgi:hypothetical protein
MRNAETILDIIRERGRRKVGEADGDAPSQNPDRLSEMPRGDSS